MEPTIKIKFTIASTEGIELFKKLTNQRFLELHQHQIDQSVINQFVVEKYNSEYIIEELNDFTNQLLVVYVGEEAAGYALLKEKGEVPEHLSGRKLGYLRNFEILKDFEHTAAGQLLLSKCLQVFKSFDAVIAITKVENSSMQNLLRSNGFEKESQSNHSFLMDNNEIPADMLLLKL